MKKHWKRILASLLTMITVCGLMSPFVELRANASDKAVISDSEKNGNLTAAGAGFGLYFEVETKNELQVSADWSKRYSPSEGGIYVNGKLDSSIQIIKIGTTSYYVALENKYTLSNGTKVKIDGVFGGVTFEAASFMYSATSTSWFMTDLDGIATVEEDKVNGENSRPQNGIYFYVDTENAWAESWSDSIQAVEGGVYVNGELDETNIKLLKIGPKRYYFAIDGRLGKTIPDGTEIKIDGVFSDGTTKVQFEEATYVYGNNTKWRLDMPVNATITVLDPQRTTNGAAGGFYFRVAPKDPLKSSGGWDVRYTGLQGGIYVNDTLQSKVPLIKIETDLYYVGLADAKITASAGTKVRIDGIIGNTDTKVRLMPATFEYLHQGKAGWTLTASVEAEPLQEETKTVYDLYEFYNYSAISVPNETLFNVADLSRNTNVALRMDVKMDYTKGTSPEAQYIELGISKAVANNIWNASGYNVRIIPEKGTLYIFDYAKNGSVQVSANNIEAVKKDFTLEIGVVNVVQSSAVVARRFYVNVNEVEIMSYLDWNLNTPIGKYVAARTVKANGDLTTTLESVSTKGHEMVDINPIVQDLSELIDGLSTVKANSGRLTPVGQTKAKDNIAIRTKVTFNTEFNTYKAPRYDEFIIGIGQMSKTTIWDVYKSGYEVWFRPDTIFIGTEAEPLAQIKYDVPDSFTLEFGTYDVEIQKSGETVSVYGKKVYVKINDVVVLTYLDQKQNRVLGDYVVAYTTNSVDATLGSLTSDTYLIRKGNTVADIYDATAMSQVTLNQGRITQLGKLSKEDSVAFKTKVKIDGEFQEFKLAMSKTQNYNFWGAEGSGWQFWIRPQHIYIGYGVDSQAAAVQYTIKNEFILEVGTRDVQYSTGNTYAREVYLKIDGEEIISWVDKDGTRKLGTYMTAYAGKGAEVTFTSLTTSGYVPVDSVAVSSDLIDASQYAAVKLQQAAIMNLGTMDSYINKSVKMNVDLTRDTTEFKLALGKSKSDAFWLEGGHGYQFWFRPRQNHMCIGYGENETANTAVFTFPEHFELEIGARTVKYENGKKFGTRVFIKIDGVELLSWIDTDTNRKFGKYFLAYASKDADVTLSTLYETVELPVTYKVNGQTKTEYELATASAIIVPEKTSRATLNIWNDAKTELEFEHLYMNGADVKPDENLSKIEKGFYSFVLKNPKESTKLTVELTAHALTTDEVNVLDFYDIAKVPSVTVKKDENIGLGNMIANGKQCGANTAIQFMLDIPKGFNSIRMLIFGSGNTVWTAKGVLFDIQRGKVLICYPLGKSPLVTVENPMFADGNTLAVEVGVAKCYVDGVYKYDRKYVKAGMSVDTMELIAWYDDVERGKYGTAVVTRGTDVEGSNFTFRSMNKFYELKDVSDTAETTKLSATTVFGTEKQAIYYPQYVKRGDKAQIKLFTQEGMKLNTFKVSGANQTMSVAADGGYVYELSNVSGNVEFAYTIVEDNQKYSVTAEKTDNVEVIITESEVSAGGSTEVVLKADKGYIPKQVMINDTDCTEQFTYDADENGWKMTLSGIRENKVIKPSVMEKNYTLNVKGVEHAEITYGGDVKDGKLPAGGTLQFAIKPENGWLIQSVSINGDYVGISDGIAKIDAFYTEGDSAEIEVVLKEGLAIKLPVSSENVNAIAGVIGGIATIGLIVVMLVILKKKRKKG